MLPIDQTSFWKERIEKSKDYGDIHHSVYVSRNSLWDSIEKVHFEILKRECSGLVGKILDAGCGFGRACTPFSPVGYIGVDFSEDFLNIARQKYPRHEFVRAELQALPFPDHSFNIAFCISIRQMILGNLGPEAWQPMENELKRVADKVILLEYENPEEYSIL